MNFAHFNPYDILSSLRCTIENDFLLFNNKFVAFMAPCIVSNIHILTTEYLGLFIFMMKVNRKQLNL